jgi:hypothetical protein
MLLSSTSSSSQNLFLSLSLCQGIQPWFELNYSASECDLLHLTVSVSAHRQKMHAIKFKFTSIILICIYICMLQQHILKFRIYVSLQCTQATYSVTQSKKKVKHVCEYIKSLILVNSSQHELFNMRGRRIKKNILKWKWKSCNRKSCNIVPSHSIGV